MSVRYHWTINPPSLPSGIEEDPLVGRWRSLDEEWRKRFEQVRSAVDNAEKAREGMGKLFSRLKGAALGFEKSHEDLLKNLKAIDSTKPSSVGTKRARELFNVLISLENDTAKLKPWFIETAVSFRDSAKARAFEKYLKSGSGREFARRHF